MNMAALTAALTAAMKGDFANAAIASTPGGIEAQEARGQRDFVANETLPIKCNGCKIAELEEMGIVYGEPVDDLFVNVQLPEGWKKIPTDHSMWSKLVDEQGRERGSIFYKAAFYDLDAHISAVKRFSYSVVPVLGWEHSDYRTGEWQSVVMDCGNTIWVSPERVEPEPKGSHSSATEKERGVWIDWYQRKNTLGSLGKLWLDEHYPEWGSPLAYWD